jgi:hypothetical protein
MKLNGKHFHKQKQILREKTQEATEATIKIGKQVSDWAMEITFYPGRIAKHVWENEFALT